MTTPESAVSVRGVRTVAGVRLETFSDGTGPIVLVLHDQDYLHDWYPFHVALTRHFSVLAPSHPGFGASERPPHIETIDDLAYLYLDLLESLDSKAAVHLVGLGLGGWLAAEMAVRCTHRIGRLVLVDALGIKVSEPTVRDIADTLVLEAAELLEISWHDPAKARQHMKLPGLEGASQDEQLTLFRNRETAALIGWAPFMHSPRLRQRLGRISVPTLVLWGESDRVVTPDYGRAFARAIPGSVFETIPAAGHYPYLEQPEEFAAVVSAFLLQDPGAAANQVCAEVAR